MPFPAREPAAPPVDPAEVARTDFCAAFVIDASGKIVAHNRTAGDLWGAGRRPLVTVPFAALFEAAPADAAAEAAWAAFKAEAGDRPAPRGFRLPDGTRVGMGVRIERAFGGGGSYIATVRPLPPPAR